jgi:hypothetical protein
MVKGEERCWGRVLGGCTGGISGEHVITESLFLGDTIGVKGLPWCREGHKFIGKASYTANILCRKHNSDLSPVDDAGTLAFATLRKVASIHGNRSDMIQHGVWAGRFDDVAHEIQSQWLERWLLKTLINMELAGKQGLAVGSNAAPGEIDRELVELAFGLRPFEKGAGLYFAAFDGEAIEMGERVQYSSWIKDVNASSYVLAGAFFFYGFRFFLCLEQAGFPYSLHIMGRELKLMHHPETINIEINGKPSQHIDFAW